MISPRKSGWLNPRTSNCTGPIATTLLSVVPVSDRASPRSGPWASSRLDEAPAASSPRSPAPPEAADEHADHRHEVELADQHLDHRQGVAHRPGGGQVPEA